MNVVCQVFKFCSNLEELAKLDLHALCEGFAIYFLLTISKYLFHLRSIIIIFIKNMA